MAIFLVGMYLFLNAYTGFWYKHMVLRKAEALDKLMQYGIVPDRWRLTALEGAKILSPALIWYYRRRLRRLTTFARSIADPKQRELCVDCLNTLWVEWKSATKLEELL
jgi:hypothetical protein